MARLDWIAVYIVASGRNGTLYTGVTSDLPTPLQHRNGDIAGFARKYGCKRLVWHEAHDTMADAILRETRIKGWRRAWKIALIEERNPQWLDLSEDLMLPRELRRDDLWKHE